MIERLIARDSIFTPGTLSLSDPNTLRILSRNPLVIYNYELLDQLFFNPNTPSDVLAVYSGDFLSEPDSIRYNISFQIANNENTTCSTLDKLINARNQFDKTHTLSGYDIALEAADRNFQQKCVPH